MESDTLSGQCLSKLCGDLSITGRKDFGSYFYNGYIRTKSTEGIGELKPYSTRSENDHAFWAFFGGNRFIACPDAVTAFPSLVFGIPFEAGNRREDRL